MLSNFISVILLRFEQKGLPTALLSLEVIRTPKHALKCWQQ